MSKVWYHAVVAFGIASDGALAPIVQRAAVDPADAVDQAKRLAHDHAGAVAFSRTADLGRAVYGPAKIHSAIGQIPRDLVVMCRPQGGRLKLVRRTTPAGQQLNLQGLTKQKSHHVYLVKSIE